ncbi:hypothetical protein [Bifidobacterium aquikefiricola]|uniref:Uncharacterized protein n=1 Tax=Bifidobacterium aquikefiricola TaxID=3059038 RepID=A0AB39U4H8_9BIFI
MADTRTAQEATRNLAPCVLPLMDTEAQEDYASCIDANEHYIALTILMGFIRNPQPIPLTALTDAFNCLNDDDKEQYRFLMDSKFTVTH